MDSIKYVGIDLHQPTCLIAVHDAHGKRITEKIIETPAEALIGEFEMSKGYWITFYRSVSDQEVLSKYAKLAAPIIESSGGRILSRRNAVKAYEAGINQRVVVIEFENVEKAIAAYESPEYQEVVKILDGFVERDLRIAAGI